MTIGYLLLDLQRDLLERPGLVPSPDAVCEAAVTLLDHARRVGIPLVHARTVVASDGSDAMPHWRAKKTMPCVRGTAGALPPPALAEHADEAVVEKQGYDAFAAPAVAAYLEAHGVSTLAIAGIFTHACIRETALAARGRRYEVLLVEEALATTDPLHGELTKRWLNERGIRTVSIRELLGGDAAQRDEASALTDALGDVEGAVRGSSALAWPARRSLLGRWAEVLRARGDELVQAMIEEIGKPRRAAQEELRRAIEHVETACDVFPSDEEVVREDCRIRYRPRGRIAIITPWNNPVAIPAGKLAPALLFGNRVVWKPSPRTPLVSSLLIRTLREAGVPADAVSLLRGDGHVAGQLVSSPQIDAVAFTGSTAAGRAVIALGRARGIPVQAELGGNNAAVVGAGVAPDAVAAAMTEAAFAFAGQRCTAVRRLIVGEDQREEILQALVRRVEALELLDPGHADAIVGPVIDGAAVRRLQRIVDEACASGARLRTGGRPPEGKEGSWFLPTILEVDDPGRGIVQEESFGPLLVVQSAPDFPRKLALQSAVSQGLVAMLFSSDPQEETEFLRIAEAGILRVNPTDFGFDARAPFGGWKESGVGPPEHGAFDRAFYALPQTVYGERAQP